MNLSFINIVLVIGLGLLFGHVNNQKNRNMYIGIMMLVFLLEASLRHPSIGMDTESYYLLFENVRSLSWEEVFASLRGRYLSNNNMEGDVGYVLFVKLMSLITKDWNFFEFLRDLIFFIPFGLYLKKYATNFSQLIFALAFYCPLLHTVPMNGGRQLLSLGICILAFNALQDKKFIRSSFLVLFGSLFHQSCLVFFVCLACSLLSPRKQKVFHILSLILIPIVWINVNSIIFFLGDSVGNEQYAGYGMGIAQGQSLTFIVLLELLSIFCLFAIGKNQLQNNHQLQVFYATIIGTTLFGPLIWANGVMIRITMYFYLFMTLLVPFAIDCTTIIKNRKLLYIVFITLISGLYLLNTGNLNYRFFWQ